MPLKIDTENLRLLMEDFYVLTGIRMVLFDGEERELLAYPEQGVPFCREMRKNPEFLRICQECDRRAFRRCREEGGLTVYRCHAGLMEAAAPLYENEEIIGYLMFGQVGSGSRRADLTRELTAICESFHCPPPPGVRSVAIKTPRQIRASAQILEACTGYIRIRDLAVSHREEAMHRLEEYVCAHLAEDLSVSVLCRELSISRSALYRLLPQNSAGGIAAFVRRKRLETAREMLRGSDLSVGEIALRVGIQDEAYFRRLFRRHVGISVKDARIF